MMPLSLQRYWIAGKSFVLSDTNRDLVLFKKNDNPCRDALDDVLCSSFLDDASLLSATPKLISETNIWINCANRLVRCWAVPFGVRLQIVDVGDFYISLGRDVVIRVDKAQEKAAESGIELIEREVLLGAALVMALAMCGVWSLHASAALFQRTTIAFLGESGQGKSTLAAYLSQCDGWRRVADDILPATVESFGINIWPHFPQLKLPPETQPFIGLPEHLPLDKICLLVPAEIDDTPAVEQVSLAQAAQAILSHTAGARMFPPDLLARHLDFCVEAAKRVPVYRLTYPHRREALPVVKSLLQDICLNTDS